MKKRKRPVKHPRKPYMRRDGTKVKGTIVNPDVVRPLQKTKKKPKKSIKTNNKTLSLN